MIRADRGRLARGESRLAASGWRPGKRASATISRSGRSCGRSTIRSGGQKHYVLDDGSILAAGYAPTMHTTEFTVEVKLPKITAVRLELLNDPNLPHGGPGRSIYGTCALTEFRGRGRAARSSGPADQVEVREGDGGRESAGARAGKDLRRPQRQAARDGADRVRERRQRI